VPVVALLAAGVVLWVPLAEALPQIGRRLLSHENLRELFPLQLSPVLAVLLASLRTFGLTGTALGLRWFDLLRCGLFGLVVLGVLTLQGRGRLGLVEAVCALSVAFTQLIVSVLWPWHLVLPTAFALVAAGPAWHALAVILTLLGGLSYFFTFTWAAGLLAVLALTLTGLSRTRAYRRR